MTTASKLLNRKDCPPGTYLLDTKSLLNLESTIVHLLISHGVKLEPNKILSRCVVCNGSIEPVYNEDLRQKIFQSYKAPEEVNVEVLDVYQCNGCSQGYWWCEKPTSSASRVKSQANRLLELCIRGGVPIDDDLGMFGYVDVEKIRGRREEDNEEISQSEKRLDVVQWLQTEDLKNPLKQMASAYASKGSQNESLPFTNVTYDFVGHLDYILYETQAMEVTNLLYVPKTFEELNDLNITNGHLLPSYDWPSDHLAIGCRLSFGPTRDNFEKSDDQAFERSKSDPVPFPPRPPLAVPWCGFIDDLKSNSVPQPTLPTPIAPSRNSAASALPHRKRCPCGCVPDVPSLFEMAELRRIYRLGLKNGGKQ